MNAPTTSQFYERFFGMPVPERRRVAEAAGMSLTYILKQVYVNDRAPVFRFSNAVRLDKASEGRLPFYLFAENADQIDWDFVRRRLLQAKRRGHITKEN